MILGRYISTELGFNNKLSDHFIEEDDGTLKASTELMVDMGMYEFTVILYAIYEEVKLNKVMKNNANI